MFSSLWKLIKAIVKKVLSVVKKVLKKLWPIIIVIAAIYFAPVIAGFLGSIGAPAWFTSSVAWVGANVTPILGTVATWIKAGASWAWSGAAGMWSTLSTSGKLTTVIGAAGMMAPKETADLIGDVAGSLTDVAGSLLGNFLSSPVGIGLLAGGLFFLLYKRRSNDQAY